MQRAIILLFIGMTPLLCSCSGPAVLEGREVVAEIEQHDTQKILGVVRIEDIVQDKTGKDARAIIHSDTLDKRVQASFQHIKGSDWQLVNLKVADLYGETIDSGQDEFFTKVNDILARQRAIQAQIIAEQKRQEEEQRRQEEERRRKEEEQRKREEEERRQLQAMQRNVGRRVCIQKWSGKKGYCGTIEDVTSIRYKVRITSIDCGILGLGICKPSECSGGKYIDPAGKYDEESASLGNSVWINRDCID